METVWTVAGHTVLDTPRVLFQTESLFWVETMTSNLSKDTRWSQEEGKAFRDMNLVISFFE